MKKMVAALFVFAFTIPALAQTTYVFDQPHTGANFRAFHLGTGYTYGRFDEYEGSLVYDREDISNSAFEFFINVESVNTNNDHATDICAAPTFLTRRSSPPSSSSRPQSAKPTKKISLK